jgi:hypothetical protein
MKDGIDSVPMMLQTPSMEALEERLRDVQRMFHRSLACWASDVLQLRQARLHHFTWQSRDRGWSDVKNHAA